jgi:hypothetical protein
MVGLFRNKNYKWEDIIEKQKKCKCSNSNIQLI